MEDYNTCKICKQTIEDNRHFRSKHKITTKDYYETYYPKYDQWTMDKIPYEKPLAKYLTIDFLNKNNQKKWLSSIDQEEVNDYIIGKIKQRMERKGLIYAFSEVELYTCYDLPSRVFLDKICDFDNLCQQAGLKSRFKKLNNPIKCDPKYENNPDYWINIDPKEQKPLKLKYPIQVKNLNYGDYELNNREESGNIVVERKSLIDLVCTLSGGISRFEAEIYRARKDNAYLIILVEEPISKLYALKSLPQFKNTKIKASPDYILYQVRSLMQDHNHINFVFCDGRKDAKLVLYKILFSNGICKDIDIQLAKSKKLI